MEKRLICLSVKTFVKNMKVTVHNIGIIVVGQSDNILFQREFYIENYDGFKYNLDTVLPTEENVVKLKDEKMLLDCFLEIYHKYCTINSDILIACHRKEFYEFISKLPENEYNVLAALAENALSFSSITNTLNLHKVNSRNICNLVKIKYTNSEDLDIKYSRDSSLCLCLMSFEVLQRYILNPTSAIEDKPKIPIGSILKY